MYVPLLSNRYLTSRVIPFVAVFAVALCVALVIIVVSVMTGFLDMVKNSGRTLMGDVVIGYPVRGIGWYDRLIDELDGVEGVEAATPVVDGWGLLKMPYPYGKRKETETVQFWAVEPESFAQVTGYADTLYWKPPTEAEQAEMSERDFRREVVASPEGEEVLGQLRDAGLRLNRPGREGAATPGICLGIHVSQGNVREDDGSYTPVGSWWMPQHELVLTTLPADTAAVSPQPRSVSLPVVNEFMSGVYLIDDKRVIIPIDVGQELLHLDASMRVDDEGEETGFVDPARATMVLVRAAEGVSPEDLRDRVEAAYERFRAALREDPTVDPATIPREAGPLAVRVQTWRQQQAQFLDPIEKERELMRTLFSLVYLVCAGLVLAIFWAIVYEKTRDIGILRSVGASRLGVAMIFVRYGLVIGVLGALVGVAMAYLVVRNINTIHDMMGRPPLALGVGLGVVGVVALVVTLTKLRSGQLLPITLGVLVTLVFAMLSAGTILASIFGGVRIWDASVYYFSVIPNEMDVLTAVTTMIGAVLFSVLGAFFPAAKAADIDPVKALRYE